jgi:hypothetical protein
VIFRLRGQQRNSASVAVDEQNDQYILFHVSAIIGQDKAIDFLEEKQADLAGALVQSNGCNERWRQKSFWRKKDERSPKKKNGTVLLCFNLFLLYSGYKSFLDEKQIHFLWYQFTDD